MRKYTLELSLFLKKRGQGKLYTIQDMCTNYTVYRDGSGPVHYVRYTVYNVHYTVHDIHYAVYSIMQCRGEGSGRNQSLKDPSARGRQSIHHLGLVFVIVIVIAVIIAIIIVTIAIILRSVDSPFSKNPV